MSVKLAMKENVMITKTCQSPNVAKRGEEMGEDWGYRRWR